MMKRSLRCAVVAETRPPQGDRPPRTSFAASRSEPHLRRPLHTRDADRRVGREPREGKCGYPHPSTVQGAGVSLSVGSLFTGVGGFDLGLECAGFDVAWQVENDKWCRQVLRARWPDVDLYGDVKDVGSDLDDVDLICGGFPCQDLSVAGKREGLAGERSGLFFEFIRIADSVAPRWVLVENVPGLLSSNDGQDFAVVLAELTGFHPDVPEGGWNSGGFCQGPKRRCFWRVLDTQHFGPPQRRRRVFLVCDSRAECGPEVLFEPESLPGHPATRREAGEGAAGESAVGVGIAGEVADVAASLNARDWRGPAPSRSVGNVAGAVKVQGGPDENDAKDGRIVSTLRVGGREQGAGNSYDNTPWFFNATQDPIHDRQAGALSDQGAAVYPTLRENWRNNSNPATEARMLVEGTAPALRGFGHGWQGQHNDDMAKAGLPTNGAIPRRLTPRECERLQGFPDDWTSTGIDADGEHVEVSDTQRYKQMGNAVSVPVAAWIGSRIVAAEMGAS